MPELTTETLLNLGFRDIGQWIPAKREGRIDYHLDGVKAVEDQVILDELNSLYAFVDGDKVKYIGKTSRSIRERFIGYCNPGQTQLTNVRCNRNIRERVSSGAEIRILVFNPISHLRYGDFEINLAAGLEDALIKAFNPSWNGRDRGRAITEEAEREEIESLADPESVAATKSAPPLPTKPIASRASHVGKNLFRIVLGEAYYNQGLINPGVESSTLLGADGDHVKITFDDGTEPVFSRINRRANPNGSVRIVGHNVAIARWFQAHFKQGDLVIGEVIDTHCIQLSLKGS